jgi:hypothetical protein
MTYLSSKNTCYNTCFINDSHTCVSKYSRIRRILCRICKLCVCVYTVYPVYLVLHPSVLDDLPFVKIITLVVLRIITKYNKVDSLRITYHCGAFA